MRLAEVWYEILIGISVTTSKDGKDAIKKKMVRHSAHTKAAHVPERMSNEHAIEVFVRLFNQTAFFSPVVIANKVTQSLFQQHRAPL